MFRSAPQFEKIQASKIDTCAYAKTNPMPMSSKHKPELDKDTTLVAQNKQIH
jgi:hypothetical protein